MTINPEDHAQRLTTTLNRLKGAEACADRYKFLVKGLGGGEFDHDAPINLLTILDLNGVDDCLWALCATIENSDTVSRLMAADFAESVLHLYEKSYPEDKRPRLAIEAARKYALGDIGAARDAAQAAAGAAWAAAQAAKVAAQAEIIRQYLLP